MKILQFLRKNHEATKSELEKILGVSHTTVNSYTQTLLDRGFVTPFGTADSNGGRKPVIIRLLPNARYAFGVNVSPKYVSLALVNLQGDIVDSTEFTYSFNLGLPGSLTQIKEHIFTMLDHHKIEREKVLGVGMAFPGLVDGTMLEYIPNLNIKKYCLKNFEEELGLDIFPENEADPAAYAEYVIGKGGDLDDFVYVSIAEGIGTGIMIDHCIFRGNRKRAGEFGHLKVSDVKLRCNCGRYGCWELFASKRALLKDSSNTINEVEYLQKLFHDYNNNVPSAVLKIEEYVHYLFSGLEAISLTLDPSCIIIGGDLGDYMQQLIDIGVKKLKLTDNFYGYESIKIMSSAIKENAALLGAALLPFEKVFNFQKVDFKARFN
ncbi:ROK family transcriptional regulator [Clostridium aceticum]|nr:ROK family transcriptional regulator [Clostridium aceticum]KJF28681.1 hypothetical protein TZ02_01910 [Clostridium aceticum]